METRKEHRINIVFSDSAFDTLKELSERKHTTMANILRDAIALEKWIQDAKEDGYHILLEKNGTCREILIR